MSGTIQPPKIILKTLEINRYTYDLINLIPHTSAQYRIFCYCDDVEVKYVTGLLEGIQYIEWTNDDWLDRFIRDKVESLPDVELKPEPVQPTVETELPVETPIESTVEPETSLESTVEPKTSLETDTPVESV